MDQTNKDRLDFTRNQNFKPDLSLTQIQKLIARQEFLENQSNILKSIADSHLLKRIRHVPEIPNVAPEPQKSLSMSLLYFDKKNYIEMGLPNLGSTCWLNSALKFIATSDHYNELFDLNISELVNFQIIPAKQLKSLLVLQSKLREVIETLQRGAPNTVLDVKLYRELISAIVEANIIPVGGKNNDPFKDQLDATEFLRALMNAFQYPVGDHMQTEFATSAIKVKYPQCMWTFDKEPEKTSPGCVKYPIKENFQDTLILENPDNGDSPLDLSDLLNAQSEVIVNIDESKIDPTLFKTTFKRTRHLINAPETLIMHFIRIIPSNPDTKSERPLLFDRELRVHIPINDGLNISKDRPSENIVAFCTYQVESVLRKFGNASTGHWVCYQRCQDQTFVCHDDSVTQPISIEDAREGCAQATELRLKKIETHNIV